MTDELDNQEVVEEPTEETSVTDPATTEQSDHGTPDGTEPETTVTEPANTGDDDDSDGDEPEFSLDKDGNLQWKLDDDEPKEGSTEQVPTEPAKEEQPTQTESKPNEPEEDEVYKVKVDGNEVEVTREELLKGYMRQSDYTRKTQSLAEERKRLENPVQPPQYTQPQNQQQPPVQRQSGPNLNEMAKSIAARNLGLASVDDLSELDFDHVSAVMDARNELRNQAYSMQRRQNAINNLETQLRADDPSYDTIMSTAKEKMEQLPYKDFERLRTAYEQGDTEPLRAFYQGMAKEYYAKAIKKVDSKKTVPPKVVQSNTVTPTKVTKKVDFRNFGKLTSDEKAQALIDLGIV